MGVACDLKDAAIDRRAICLAVVAAQEQRAEIGFDEPGCTGEFCVDRCARARARRRAVTDTNCRLRASQGDCVSLDHIAIREELHAGGFEVAEATIRSEEHTSELQ